MAEKPIIFAMANPDPEITPEEVRAVRSDAIIATGRSDYPNQINNVLGFPYIFRGALDVRASTINEAMKIAAAEALARLAREDVPDEVAAAYSGAAPALRARLHHPGAVRSAPDLGGALGGRQGGDGFRRGAQADRRHGRLSRSLRGRLDPTAAGLELIFDKVRGQSEARRLRRGRGGEDDPRRAGICRERLWHAGADRARGAHQRRRWRRWGWPRASGSRSTTPRLSHKQPRYTDFLYARLQRHGMLYRDCQRQVNQDRNVFAACMVACGDADAMVTGVTRNSFDALDEVTRVIEAKPGSVMFGLTMLLGRERPLLLADTLVHETPSPQQLADIAMQAAAKAREMGLEPRVALLSYSNFGNPTGPDGERVREAVALLDQRRPDFEYDGEMSADVALDRAVDARALSVLPAGGAGQHAGHAGAQQRQHRGEAAAAAGRRHRRSGRC